MASEAAEKWARKYSNEAGIIGHLEIAFDAGVAHERAAQSEEYYDRIDRQAGALYAIQNDYLRLYIKYHKLLSTTAAAQSREDALRQERDNQYEENVNQIFKYAELETREKALRKQKDEAVARAVLDESEWWINGHICENSRTCPGCKRHISNKEAIKALTSIRKEKKP